MTPITQAPTIRRIVVTLDDAESGRPVLDIAVRLAAVLGAELEGIFIEDINLIRLSELPFLREIRASSLVEEVISSQSMQRDLRALARQTEQMVLQAAQAMGVGCSFRVWRGHTAVETLNSSFEADVISLRGGSGAMTAYRAQSIVRTGVPVTAYAVNSINVLFSASAAADRALTAACRLAPNLGARIKVLLADATTRAEELEKRASEILVTHASEADFIALTDVSVAALSHAVQTSGSNTVLIAGADHPLLRQAGPGRCLEALSCPVLLVR